jgi:predicted metal-binding membrane protein
MAGQAAALAGPRAIRVVLPLLVLAAAAWTFTVRMGSGSVGMSAAAFAVSWVVMMAAMMLPAVSPVVALYSNAARRGLVAAVPIFVAGYLAVWAVSAIPAYAVARAVNDPLMQGRHWVGRLAGVTLVAAAVYQLTPLKAVCLRHCRSPMSFFLARSKSLHSGRAAVVAGAGHGVYCLGCCWALMLVMFGAGVASLPWMAALTGLMVYEKTAPGGRRAVPIAGIAFLLLAALTFAQI